MSHNTFSITGKLLFSSRKVVLESGDVSYFVRTRSMRGAYVHGDTVRARIVKRGDASRLAEVELTGVVRRTEDTLLGQFIERDKKIIFTVLPELGYFEKTFTDIPLGYSGNDIISWKFDREGRVTLLEKFAGKSDFDMEEKVLFSLAGIVSDFPKNILHASEILESKSHTLLTTQKQTRTDFQDWFTLTIDGKDAKDLDDAISLRILPNGNTLLAVHIADVAEYVVEGSVIDTEAYKRATSIYTPGRVIPMLPEILSNDLCSLHPGEPKLTLSCVMEILSNGQVLHTDIVEGIILSRHRGIYEEIEKSRNIDAKNPQDPELSKTLDIAYDLFEVLKKRRKKEGKIIFESTEVYFDFPEETQDRDNRTPKTPIALRKRSRLDAHMLIEEFMVLANEEVAKWCDKHEIPFLSRVHGFPGNSQLEVIREIIGIGLTSGTKKPKKGTNPIEPGEIRRFLDNITDERELYRLSRLLLPKMAKALYTDKKSLHFGLALGYYSHFTSPIRRYPDLQVHRIIKEKIHGLLTPERVLHYKNLLRRVARHASERERKAEDIERVFDALYACRYMQNKVGEKFLGRISGVADFAIFIELENGVEGTLYIPKNTYIINQIRGSVENQAGKILFQIGNDIRVQVERVDMNEKRIILEITP